MLLWVSENYGWLHLLAAALGLVYSAKKTDQAWKIAAIYLLIFTVAYPVFYRKMDAISMYTLAIFFESGIILAMAIFRHPMARYIAYISCFCIAAHSLAMLAYITPHPILYDIQQSHKVTIPILELAQVIAVFAFSSRQFAHLDKPVQKQEPYTWQAASAHR